MARTIAERPFNPMLYSGAYDLAIDEKKRLSIPSAIRNRLDPKQDGEGFYLVLGDRPGTLSLFADKYFERYAERLAAELQPGRDRQTFESLFYSKCAHLEMDKQGRVQLPEHMVEAAQLGRSVYLTGARDHLDLWNRDDYDQFVKENVGQLMDLQMRARQGMGRTTSA